MTNLEAIRAELYPYDVDHSVIVKACIDNEVDENDTYCVDYKVDVIKAAIHILRMLSTINSESDSGYSISYNKGEVLKHAKRLASENGLKDIVAEIDEEISSKPKVFIGYEW